VHQPSLSAFKGWGQEQDGPGPMMSDSLTLGTAAGGGAGWLWDGGDRLFGRVESEDALV